MPNFEAARRITARLEAVGNLASDGRPILGLDAADLLAMTLEAADGAFLVPAHVWTPWFSIFGSKSGFDSLAGCFGDLADEVFAVETGLSSDPPMNRLVSDLDRCALVSNSDAHSAATIGREATLIAAEPGFAPMHAAMRGGRGLEGTLEFHPEQGKYHFDGHRNCDFVADPRQKPESDPCPRCGRPLTVGVLHRVLDLADREEPVGVPASQSLVALSDVIAEVLGVGAKTKRVGRELHGLRSRFGPELRILREVPIEDLSRKGGRVFAEAVRRVRSGELHIDGGYDGRFGTVRIFEDRELTRP